MKLDDKVESLGSPIVAVIRLGSVGLPLVVEFGKRFRTISFAIATAKVEKCRRGCDLSRELSSSEMRQATKAEYTSTPPGLRNPFAAEEVCIPAVYDAPLDTAGVHVWRL